VQEHRERFTRWMRRIDPDRLVFIEDPHAIRLGHPRTDGARRESGSSLTSGQTGEITSRSSERSAMTGSYATASSMVQ
jgi:hypothetical protein